MSEERERATLVRKWMVLASADLAYAQESLRLGDRFSDKVCFHCQQAAEKALKALLTAMGVRSPKTHDIRALIAQVAAFFPDLLETLASVVDLTDYAVEIRYPDEWYAPDQVETRRALELAQLAIKTVEQKLEERQR